MKTIYLVRHGESAANAGLPTSDPALIPLTDRGRVQAGQLPDLLKIRSSVLMTSTYVRAVDTAQPFAVHHRLEPIEHLLLHEFVTLDPAAVAGTTMLERKPLVDSYWKESDPKRRMGSGAETFLEFAGRTDSFAPQLNSLPDQTVIFGHGMWFAMLLWRLTNFPVDDHLAMRAFRNFQIGLPMPNCGVYELHGQGDGAWRIRFNALVSRRMPAVLDPSRNI